MLKIFQSEAMSILSPVSGFLTEAGFTHSLNPSRNCTYGCSYCYVPTMRFQGGLRPEDWKHWGHWTTFKTNAAELLRRALRGNQVIYCSPLTDPYQPAEEQQRLMPEILRAVTDSPPKCFVIQTRGPLILRDLDLLKAAGVRVSFPSRPTARMSGGFSSRIARPSKNAGTPLPRCARQAFPCSPRSPRSCPAIRRV